MQSTTRKIVILGFMGCGKSEVARRLAKDLDRRMVDLDLEITAEVGRSPAQLIVEDGEGEFRQIETNTLRRVLANERSVVVALGGGAWIESANRELLERDGAITIWLNAPFESCWRHISTSREDRPLGRSPNQAHDLFERRRPVYELAGLHIIVEPDESIASIAARIEAKLATL